MAFGLTFISGTEEKHTFKDFGLKMLFYNIPKPEPKINKIDLPFSSGSVDLTEATGIVPYNDITGMTFEFKLYDGSYEKWEIAKTDLAMFLHGKKLKMIIDSDTPYYYMVRLSVNPSKSNKVNSTIVLTGEAEPYKYNLLASNEPWEWDPFSFVNGIIQDTSDIYVNGTTDVNIIAGAIPTCPEFYVSKIETALSIYFDDVEYKFNKGTGYYRFPQIRISGEDAVLRFVGKARVSISYRGRYL